MCRLRDLGRYLHVDGDQARFLCTGIPAVTVVELAKSCVDKFAGLVTKWRGFFLGVFF